MSEEPKIDAMTHGVFFAARAYEGPGRANTVYHEGPQAELLAKINQLQAALNSAESALAHERAAERAAVVGWRPIETAPTDELAPIWLFNGEATVGSRWEGYWASWLHDYMEPQPTHWHPMPAPPYVTIDLLPTPSVLP